MYKILNYINIIVTVSRRPTESLLSQLANGRLNHLQEQKITVIGMPTCKKNSTLPDFSISRPPSGFIKFCIALGLLSWKYATKLNLNSMNEQTKKGFKTYQLSAIKVAFAFTGSFLSIFTGNECGHRTLPRKTPTCHSYQNHICWYC